MGLWTARSGDASGRGVKRLPDATVGIRVTRGNYGIFPVGAHSDAPLRWIEDDRGWRQESKGRTRMGSRGTAARERGRERLYSTPKGMQNTKEGREGYLHTIRSMDDRRGIREERGDGKRHGDTMVSKRFEV